MKVVFIYADTQNAPNCSLFNCLYPNKAINKLEGHSSQAFHIDQFRENGEIVQKACLESDIIIIERNFFGDTNTLVSFYKARNKCVAGILDDAYHLIKKNNAAFPFWNLAQVQAHNNETGEDVRLNLVPPPLQQLRWGLRMVKGLIVPSKALAEDWSLYTKTYRIHNYLDEERYVGEEKLYPHEDTIWLAWSGSLSHLESFEDSGLLMAIADTIKRFKNVRILISGDKRVYDKIPVPEGKKIFSNFVPENQYSNLLRSADIGIAPLVGTYDIRRSWLKFLDYAICKVPVIASDFEPYEELGDYGLLTKNDYQSWKSNLARIIKNYPEYKQRAETTSYEFAMSQTFDRNIDKLLAVYQQIIDDDYPDKEQIWHPNAIH